MAVPKRPQGIGRFARADSEMAVLKGPQRIGGFARAVFELVFRPYTRVTPGLHQSSPGPGGPPPFRYLLEIPSTLVLIPPGPAGGPPRVGAFRSFSSTMASPGPGGPPPCRYLLKTPSTLVLVPASPTGAPPWVGAFRSFSTSRASPSPGGPPPCRCLLETPSTLRPRPRRSLGASSLGGGISVIFRPRGRQRPPPFLRRPAGAASSPRGGLRGLLLGRGAFWSSSGGGARPGPRRPAKALGGAQTPRQRATRVGVGLALPWEASSRAGARPAYGPRGRPPSPPGAAPSAPEKFSANRNPSKSRIQPPS